MYKTYWSCSKFADWLRDTKKPPYATIEEWEMWEKKAKRKKLRYWLADDGLDYLQDFIYWPANRLRDISHYIDNRWITKTHTLTSNLKRGQWHDLDVRLLEAAFDELVNFVEIEVAWMQAISEEKGKKKYKTAWYHNVFRLKRWRNSDAGISHLNWAKTLTYDEYSAKKSDPEYGKPTPQALAAEEILKLYFWWKNERPERLDADQASGLEEYYSEESKKEGKTMPSFLPSKKQNEHLHNLFELSRKIEDKYEQEDTEMLIRLIKIRHNLWT